MSNSKPAKLLGNDARLFNNCPEVIGSNIYWKKNNQHVRAKTKGQTKSNLHTVSLYISLLKWYDDIVTLYYRTEL